jgi:vacuolar-type H+-ATPase subunit I/STV1
MKTFSFNSKSLFKITVTLLAIPTLLFLIVSALILFLAFGGGWAYAGAAGCHFVLNPLGMLMLAVATLGLFAFIYVIGREVARRYRIHQALVD